MTKILLPGANTAGQPNGYPTLDGASGLLVPAYAELNNIAAPPVPAAGKTRLYVDSAGLLQLLPAAGGGRRIAAHWGSGTAFPTGPAAGDTFLRSDVGTSGTLYQYAGAGQGTGGWIVEGAIVATSTTRPAVGLYAGVQLYETDTTFTWSYTGALWQPVSAGACSGKMWLTTGGSANLTVSTEYKIPMTGSRLFGGFTFVGGATNQITVPLDGLYDVVCNTYWTNAGTGLANAWLNRIRAAVASVTVPIQGPQNKVSSTLDLQTNWGGSRLPFKAGDGFTMSVYNYSATMAYYGVNEIQGCIASLTWVAPLNGAPPI